jgi:hypothetical protein
VPLQANFGERTINELTADFSAQADQFGAGVPTEVCLVGYGSPSTRAVHSIELSGTKHLLLSA